MNNQNKLHLSSKILARYGLPDIAYPWPLNDLQAAQSPDGELPLAAMLQALQQQSADGASNWLALESAMERIAQLLAVPDGRAVISLESNGGWLELGPVDLAGELVTIQREESLVAAISAREDGRLRVAVFRPLDGKSVECLTGLGQLPHPEHGVCMRENNWQYALDCSATLGNHYAAERGEAYLSYWERGLGLSREGDALSAWHAQRALNARPVAVVAAELGMHSTSFS